MVRVVPVSFEFLRGVLGVLGVIFAHLAGRSGAKVRKGRQKLSGFYGWVIRAAAFALGWWDASRARPQEDLTHQIFPE